MNKVILLVEDNADSAWTAAYILESHGWQVETRGTLAGTIAYHGPTPAVILLDLNLPDSRDVNTLHEVARAYPGTPIVVLTGQANAEDLVSEPDANEVIVKTSATPELLDQACQRAVKRQAMKHMAEPLIRALEVESEQVDRLADKIEGDRAKKDAITERAAPPQLPGERSCPSNE